MSKISTVRNAIFVLDGVDSARDAAATADLLFSKTIDWSVLAVTAGRPELATGTTGFAAPVMTPEQTTSLAMADLIAADAATATTARAFGRRPVTQSVVRGEPTAAVRRYIAEHPTDLVVVGSSQLAERLVGEGIVPVLVVSAMRPASTDGPVLVAVDDSPLDEAVISAATRLFDASATEYVAVHVGPTRSVARAIPIATFAPGSTGDAMVSMLADDLQSASVAAEGIVRQTVADTEIADAEHVGEVGDAATGILTAARDHDASMIVLGTHDRGWLSRLFRPSVTDAVLLQTQRPVLVLAMPSDRRGERTDAT